ncbi:nuclear transport factor 2 family protein [Rudanella lutea]|jgi:hypothetical protein|uniref:nuclear transport factor 2 family protein n=1 Tax=Rudanella lutea TaxID=451374 RepID=UPI00036BF36B|nr:nuclear transport factor 2 family protein [Rudanella lutea]
MKYVFFIACLLGLTPALRAQQEAPEKVVQRQLEAYNAQNLAAFVATYADSIEIYRFPNKLQMQGKAALEKSYGELFKNNPNNYAALLGRIVQGNTVIDQEKVTGRGDREVRATAIYEVKNGLIRRVWFVY